MGYTTQLLLTAFVTNTARVEVEGIDPPSGANYYSVDDAAIDDDFLSTVGIELVAGRGFDATDVADGEPLTVPP